MNLYKQLYVILSNILSILNSKEVGLKLKHLSFESFFKIGIKFASFQNSCLSWFKWDSRAKIIRLISFLLVGDIACAKSLTLAYSKR